MPSGAGEPVVSDFAPFLQFTAISPSATATPQNVEVALYPLLRGFVARLSCPVEGWFKTYGARQIRLDYYTDNANFEPQSVEIYTVEDGQNLTLQKTILTLGFSQSIKARFVLLDENNAPFWISSLKEVVTLPKGAPVT
jgi:hypothetical protein